MGTIILKLLLRVLTSEATKTLIAIGVNKLLEKKGDGITSDVAKVMIDGIAKSKMNPTKEEMFSEALTELSQGVSDGIKKL